MSKKQKYISIPLTQLYDGAPIDPIIEELQKASEGLQLTRISISTQSRYCGKYESEYTLNGWRDYTPEEIVEEKEKAKEARKQDRIEREKVKQQRRNLYETLKKEFEPDQ